MLYHSTRSDFPAVDSAQAVLEGLAPDGGLYVPSEFPAFSLEEIASLSGMNYEQRAAFVLARFLPDFTREELEKAIAGAYGTGFDHEAVAPMVKVGDWAHSLELWHGPTLAFKDMALQMLPQLLSAALRETGEDKTVCILVATSGDTGKAALAGFQDVPGIRICVFYPDGGVSDVQRRQMVSQEGENVTVCAVRGFESAPLLHISFEATTSKFIYIKILFVTAIQNLKFMGNISKKSKNIP